MTTETIVESTKTELIPFAGGQMEATIGPDGKPWVCVKRVCDELGLDFRTQLRKLRGKSWARVVIMTAVASDGKQRDMAFLNARAVPGWAISISASKVRPELVAKLEAYQREAAEVLAQHFMGPQTAAMVPRIEPEDDAVLAMLGQVEVMAAASHEISQKAMAACVIIAKATAANHAAIAKNNEAWIDCRARIDVLAARDPVQHVTLSIPTKGEALQALRTEFDRELKEGARKTHPGENLGDVVTSINRDLKRYVGAKRSNWRIDHFHVAIRYLKAQHGIDIAHVMQGVQ